MSVGDRPHAVLLDIDVFGNDWEGWLTRQSERFPHVGVLVCTTRSTTGQRVRGLRAGADDWMDRPCDPEEVIARLQAIVRGHRLGLRPDPQAPLRSGELEVRVDLFEAFANGRPAGLTSREFEVLLYLARMKDTVVERERLYSEVWGYAMVRGSRSIDTFVRKVRTKLEDVSPGWRYIHTHKGLGYRFVGEPVKRAGDNQGMRAGTDNEV
ncbi:MAG TPA: response regulator transcription factor [Solirubrobacteraceae bacterium]|nr:response regulator transcription factor [Solirubrobacteraceae bacterium]